MSDMGFLEKENSIDLKLIGEKCQVLKEKQKSIDMLKMQLEQATKEERNLSREEIPNLLLQAGLTSVSLETGEVIKIQENLSVSLPKKDLIKRNKVLTFIINNGGANIIKRKVTVEEPELLILNFLKENKIPFDDKKDIHASTLKAWFKNKLGMSKASLQELELQDIPGEAGIFVYNETKIK